MGHELAQLVEAQRYKPEVAGPIPDGVIDTVLPAALWLCDYSASGRNLYKEYFLGVKAAGV